METEARYTHYIYKQFSLAPKMHSVKLVNEAKKIILNYYNARKGAEFVFPYLPDELANEKYGTEKLKGQIESKTVTINKNLGKIAEILSLQKFSTHAARRSFAQIARKYHDKQLDIMQALGHNDLETTQGYFDKTDFSGVDRALESVEKRKKSTEILPK